MDTSLTDYIDSLGGGGGSKATSTGPQSPISGTGTPSGVSSWLPYAQVGVVVLAVLIVIMGRKKER